MRFRSVLIVIALAAFVLFALSCSKKSSPSGPVDPAPVCSVSPTTLAFGNVPIGTNTEKTFTINNTGGGTLSGTLVDTCETFSVVGSNTYSLTSGASKTFTVRFSPTTATLASCTIGIGSGGCAGVVCAGNGQSVTPICDVQTPLIDFGGIVVGGSAATKILAIQNTGGGTLAGSITGLSGEFRLTGPLCFSLGAHQTHQINVDFSPNCVGAQACTLSLGPSACTPIILKGNGVVEYFGSCAVRVLDGDEIDFGEVPVGQTVERTVMVRNGSTYPSVGLVDDFCPDFETAFEISFLGGRSGPRTIRFAPSREGEQCCMVQIGCRMDGEGTLFGVRQWLTLRGTGVALAPR